MNGVRMRNARTGVGTDNCYFAPSCFKIYLWRSSGPPNKSITITSSIVLQIFSSLENYRKNACLIIFSLLRTAWRRWRRTSTLSALHAPTATRSSPTAPSIWRTDCPTAKKVSQRALWRRDQQFVKVKFVKWKKFDENKLWGSKHEVLLNLNEPKVEDEQVSGLHQTSS